MSHYSDAESTTDEEVVVNQPRLRRRKGVRFVRRSRSKERDASRDEEILELDEKEKNRVFWIVLIKYIVTFIVFVLLHQTVTVMWLDPWRNGPPQSNTHDKVKDILCPGGGPCNYDIPQNL